jgi:hypothetical protein
MIGWDPVSLLAAAGGNVSLAMSIYMRWLCAGACSLLWVAELVVILALTPSILEIACFYAVGVVGMAIVIVWRGERMRHLLLHAKEVGAVIPPTSQQ